MSDLPEGWVEASIEDLRAAQPNSITDGPYGSNLKTSHYTSQGPQVVRLGNIGRGNFLREDVACISDDHYQSLEKHHVFPGDLVIAALGDPIGRACQLPDDLGPALVKADCFRFRPTSQVDASYLIHWFNSLDAQSKFANAGHGLGRVRINLSDFRQTFVPVAPIAEQRRIVAKINTLSERSKRARNHLDHVPRLIERYKRAVIEAALSTEREIIALREVCFSISDGDHQAPPKATEGIPFITISAINDGTLRIEKATRYVPQTYYDQLKATRTPQVGDVLFSVTGSVGIPAIVNTDKPFVFQRHIAILKPNPQRVSSNFLLYVMRSESTLKQVYQVATGTAQLTVPLSGLREFAIPCPPLERQEDIVRRIESAFAWIDRLASEATSARKLIDHLDQAILSKAFRGELVPQDPTDEPASVLLERIRAERTVAKPSKGRRRSSCAVM